MIHIPQRAHNDCAKACLQMILLTNGYNISASKISYVGGNLSYLSLGDFIMYLTKFAINSKAYVATSKKLVDISAFKQVMIHYKRHFRIIIYNQGDKWLVFDPLSYKPKLLKSSVIEKRWDGFFLYFEDRHVANHLYVKPLIIPYPFKLFLFDLLGTIVLFSFIFK